MNLVRSAERVLGITSNQLTIKNTLNDTALYQQIKQFKQTHSSNSIDEQWSKVSTFVSLLYAKALNINEDSSPQLHWIKSNGLLKKQFQLAEAISLIVEGNNLSILENSHIKRITSDSLSTKVYFKGLDIVKQLDNEQIYIDLKQSINNFHLGLNKWSEFEELFFNQNDKKPKLTFDNYNDYLMWSSTRDQNQLIGIWESWIQCTYANLLGYACSSMSILGDHNYNVWKSSFDFGSNFAFDHILNQQIVNYFTDGPDDEQIKLQLPVLMYLKQTKDNEQRIDLMEMMYQKRYCSIEALRLKTKVKNSEETLNQIKIYGQSYRNKIQACLRSFEESPSKRTLLLEESRFSEQMTD